MDKSYQIGNVTADVTAISGMISRQPLHINTDGRFTS